MKTIAPPTLIDPYVSMIADTGPLALTLGVALAAIITWRIVNWVL